MRVASGGLGLDLPAGWEARVYRTPTTDGLRKRADGSERANPPILHAATFPLPEGRGDYGSGAVESMRPEDVFVSLIDMGADDAGSPLFTMQGLPQVVEPERFGPDNLQRILPGQAGTQFFFTEAGRAFVLYVVLGSFARRAELARRVEQLLSTVVIEPGGAGA